VREYCDVPKGKIQVNSDLTVSAQTAQVMQKKSAPRLPFRFGSIMTFDSYNMGLIDLSCLPEEPYLQASVTYYPDLAMLRLVFAQRVVLYPTITSISFASSGRAEWQKAKDIVERYQDRGQSAAIAFATELAQAGLKGNARW
jgi:hypothetical protein